MRWVVFASVVVGLAGWSGAGAVADESGATVLRISTVAPDGTEWARESRAFAQAVDDASHGGLKVKWYFSGIAGDELQALDRMRRNQIDGMAGSVFCERLAPSLRALEVLGMTADGAHAAELLRSLMPDVERELTAKQLNALFLSLGFGHRVLFSRQPVRSLAELRAGHYWVWDLDEVLRRQLVDMGLHVVPLPLADARRAYEEGKVDGFIVIPQAALAFQYSSVARYYTDLETGYLPGCLVVKTAAIDPIPYRNQLALGDAAAKLKVRFEATGLHMDEQLVGSLFGKQGLSAVPMSPAFRSEWMRAGRESYGRLREQLVPSAAARALLEAAATSKR